MERIVSRADLLDTAASSPSSPDTAQIKDLKEFDFVHCEDLQDVPDGTSDDDGGDGFAFKLFVSSAASASNTTRVRLDSPDLTDAEPGLVNPNRHTNYYFTGHLGKEQRQNFEAAAMSGRELLALSKVSWPGMAYSWKVLHVPSTKKQRRLLEPSNTVFANPIHDNITAKRKRLGKKARLAKRIKFAAANLVHEAEQREAGLKKAEEREKRTRRNREKKIKKKIRERSKKVEIPITSTAADAAMAEDTRNTPR